MRKKLITTLLVTTLLCTTLVGCGHQHTWTEATCTEPKTCSECGETEGEALGHTWVEATCAEPKHCSVCGETEGEALEHTWVEATCAEPKHCSVCGETEGEALEHTLTEANYQQAATCKVCGATVGEPLQADFEKENISCNAELDKTYSCISFCNREAGLDYTTILKATFSDYKTFASDDTHEALEGYEWKTITVSFVAEDDNAQEYGFDTTLRVDDYYNGEALVIGENYTINYNGVDYDECFIDYKSENSGWIGDIYTSKYIFSLRVPEGYDGNVVCTSSDSTKTDEDGNKIYDICFRLL